MADTDLLDSPYTQTISNNREVQKAIRAIVREHEAKWQQLMVTEMIRWSLHSTTIVSMICLVLYVVSLFFPSAGDRTTTRIIVEACIFLCLIILSLLVRLRLACLDHASSVAPVKDLLRNFKEADTKLIEDVTTAMTVKQVEDIVRRSIYRRSAQFRSEHLSPLDRILSLIHDRVVFGLVASLLISLIAAIVRVSVESGPVRSQWHVIFFEQKIYIVLPLLEFVTPLLFFLVSSVQNARVLALFQTQQVTHKSPKSEELNPWSPGGRRDSSQPASNSSSSSSSSSGLSSRSSSSDLSFTSSLDHSSDSSSVEDGADAVPINSLGDLESAHHSSATLPVPRRMPQGSLTRDYFWRIIWGDASLGILPRNSVADVLANVTMLACLDQRPVREPHPFAEKVLILGRTHHRSATLATNSSKHNLQDANEAAAHNAIFTYDRIPKLHRGATALPIILHVQPKSTTELEFVDPQWRVFMNALKPLGLNCMLNGAFVESQHDMDLSDFDEGLRKLAKAIGFSDGSIRSYDFILELRSDLTRLKHTPRRGLSRKHSHLSNNSRKTPEDQQEIPQHVSELTTVPEATEPTSISSSNEDITDTALGTNQGDMTDTEAKRTETDVSHDSSVPPRSETPSMQVTTKAKEENETNDEKIERSKTPSSEHSSKSPSKVSQSPKDGDKMAESEEGSNQGDGDNPEKTPSSSRPSTSRSSKPHSKNSSTGGKDLPSDETDQPSKIENSVSSSSFVARPSSPLLAESSKAEVTPVADESEPPSLSLDPSAPASPALDTCEVVAEGRALTEEEHRANLEKQEPLQAHPMSEKATYLVVRNNQSSKLELLTTGDPLVVLSHCTQYWNGFEIKKLTRVDRRNIRQVLHHWAHNQSFLCVGHSYRPVPVDYYKAVLAAGAHQSHTPLSTAPRSLRGSLTRQDRTRSVSSYDSEDFLDLEEIKNDQIWIGLVGLRHQPKPMAPLFVDHLDHSHIRFVFFSEENEQHSKVFADKLGLETGWNSCITLRDRPNENENHDESIQKLPVGVSSVRDHLINIDNVPLLVRLFVDSNTSNKAEMIEIAEEFGEVCLSMGTLADIDNPSAFLDSALSFGLFPDAAKQDNESRDGDDSFSGSSSSSDDFDEDSSTASHHRTKPVPKNPKSLADHHHHHHHRAKKYADVFLFDQQTSGSLVTDILRLSCHFVSSQPNSFVDIVELLTLGRRLEQQTLMFAWLFIFAHAGLNIHQLISSVCFVTVSLTGLQIFVLGFLIIPLQAFSLLWNPRPPGLSTLISEKNTKKHEARVIRYSFYALIRMLPLILVALAVFVWTLYFTWTPFNSPSAAGITKLQYIFGGTSGVEGYNPYTDKAFEDALSFSQNVSLFALTIYIVTHSLSCIHRTHSLLVVSPKHQIHWFLASALSIAIAIVYFVISEHDRLHLFKHIHPYMYILLFGWLPFQILLDEIVKRHTREHYQRTQDILKLDYNTKLGMYSPI